MSQADSIASVAEKAQHDPHCPWSFTGVTIPLVLQSTEEGAVVMVASSSSKTGMDAVSLEALYVRYLDLNSAE